MGIKAPKNPPLFNLLPTLQLSPDTPACCSSPARPAARTFPPPRRPWRRHLPRPGWREPNGGKGRLPYDTGSKSKKLGSWICFCASFFLLSRKFLEENYLLADGVPRFVWIIICLSIALDKIVKSYWAKTPASLSLSLSLLFSNIIGTGSGIFFETPLYEKRDEMFPTLMKPGAFKLGTSTTFCANVGFSSHWKMVMFPKKS